MRCGAKIFAPQSAQRASRRRMRWRTDAQFCAAAQKSPAGFPVGLWQLVKDPRSLSSVTRRKKVPSFSPPPRASKKIFLGLQPCARQADRFSGKITPGRS